VELEVEFEVALAGMRNQRGRAVDLVAGRRDLDDAHTVEQPGPHTADEGVRIARLGRERDKGLCDHMPPVVKGGCHAGADVLGGSVGGS
jgi:hypothetical protein